MNLRNSRFASPRNTNFQPFSVVAMNLNRLLPYSASVLLVAVFVLFLGQVAQSQSYTWDAGFTGGPNDGTGTWGPTLNNWWSGSVDVIWPNTTSSIAQFGTGSGGNSAYVVTVDPTGVTAGGVVFQNQAYTLTGSTLTVGGSLPTITTNAASASIGSVIAGGSGLTKAGSGGLTLQNFAAYAGPTNVSAGTLQMSSAGALPVGVMHFIFQGNTNDSGSGALNATIQNGPATYLSTGPAGAAISLSGSQYLTQPKTTGLLADTAYTVSTWVNVATQPVLNASGGPALLSTRNGNTFDSFDLVYEQTTAGIYKLHADIGNGVSTWLSTTADYTLPSALTGWNLITYSVSRSLCSIYVNGALVNSIALAAGTPNFMMSGQTLSLGSQEGGTSSYGYNGYLQGSLADTVVFNSSLDSAAITSLYQSQAASLPGSTTVSISSGSTWALNGGRQAVSGISGNGNIALGAGGLLAISAASNATFGGVISDSGIGSGIALSGSAALTLSGPCSFIGGTNVSGGTVQLANGSALMNSTVTLVGGGLGFALGTTAATLGGLAGSGSFALQDSGNNPVSLTVGNNGASTAYSGTMSGNGSFFKNGSGTLNMTGLASTFSGSTTVNQGTLELSSFMNLANSGLYASSLITVNNGGKILVNTSNALQGASSSAGPLVINAGGIVTTVSNGVFCHIRGPLSLNGGTLSSGTGGINGYWSLDFPVTANGAIVSTLSASTMNWSGTQTFTVNDPAGTLYVPGSFAPSSTLSNNFGLTLVGPGTMILARNNIYMGVTTVSSGTLEIGNGMPGSDGSISGASIVNNSALVYNTAAFQAYAGVISGSGSLNKAGPGTLLLSGTNTYTGATNISGGALRIAPIASVTPGSQLYLNAASVGGISDGSAVSVVQDLSGNGWNTSAGTGTVTYLSTGLGGAPTLVFNGSSYLSDGLSSSGNSGTIFVVMSPSNTTQTGAFVGSAANGGAEFRQVGTQLGLVKQGSTNLATSTSGAIANAGQIVAVTYVQGASGSEQFYVNGLAVSTTQNSPTTTFTANQLTTIGGAANGDDFNGKISAIVSYNSLLTPTQIAATTAALNNQFFGGPANYQVLPSTTDVNISAASAGLDLAGMSQSVASLSGVAGSFVWLGGAALTVGGDGASTTFAGTIADAGGAGLGSGGSLIVTGPGTLTLTDSNAYSGATTISGGTLQIGDGGSPGSGPIVDNSLLVFAHSDAGLTIANSISGSGSLFLTGGGTVTLSGSNNFGGTTVIKSGALQVGAGGNSGSLGPGIVTNNGALVFSRSDSALNVTSAISGSGTVIQNGSGSTILSGTNLYTGSTTINSGKLYLNGPNSTLAVSIATGATLGGSGSITSGLVTVSNSGSLEAGFGGLGSLTMAGLTFNNNASIVVANVGNYGSLAAIGVTGINALTASGGGNSITFALSGAAPAGSGTAHLLHYAGSIQGAGLSAPSLDTSNVTGLGARSLLSLTGTHAGYIDLIYSVDYPIWSGSGNASWTTASQSPKNWKLASNGSATDFLVNDTVFFNDTAATASVNINAADVSPSGIAFNNNTKAYVLQGSHGIAGSASLVMNGSAGLTIANANSYTGGTYINAGTLKVANAYALPSGAGAGNVVLSNTVAATLDLNGMAAVYINGLAGGSNTPTGRVINSGAGISTLNIGAGGAAAAFSGVITDNNGSGGQVALNLVGGLETLAGSDTYTGGTTVSGGTLQLGNVAALGAGGLTANAGVVDLAGYSPTLASLGGAAGTITLSGSQNSVLTVNQSGSTSFGGSLNDGTSATLRLVQSSGTLVLAGASQMNSQTTVQNSAALVVAGALTAAGAGVQNSATLQIEGLLTAPMVTVSGAGKIAGAAGIVNLSSSASGLLYQSTAQSTFSGSIQGVGGVTVAGPGSLTLNGANTYGGTTYINGGVLGMANAGALPAGGAITFGGGTLQYNGGNAADYSNAIVNSSAPAAIDTNGSSVTFGNALSSSNSGGLTKLGAGLLTLTAINNYSGVTTVSCGTLQLGGGFSSVGSVAGNIVNNASLVFANPLPQVFGGIVSGNGSFTKQGFGTLVLTSSQIYSGATDIREGTLALGSATSISGFGGTGIGFTVNSSGINGTPITNDVLTLTDGNSSEARTVFYNTPIDVAVPFTTSFVYKESEGGSTALADGAAFILQNDSRGLSALGAGGGGLGYLNITPSVAVQFELYTNNGGVGTALTTGGTIATNSSTSPVSLTSGHQIKVTLTYDGSNLLETLQDLTKGANYSRIYGGINLESAIGSSLAYVGFSGATGSFNSKQTISSFSLTSTGAAPDNILPTTTALSIESGTLDLYGGAQTVAQLSGSGTVMNSNVNTISVFSVGGDGSSQTWSGSIVDGGGIVALTKFGGGQLTLSGTNTFSGGTVVSGGILELDNNQAIADGSSVTVGDASAFAPAPVVPIDAIATITPVPEAGTLGIAAFGLAIAAVYRKLRWLK
jgi:autotransporter-associated beta strand protein